MLVYSTFTLVARKLGHQELTNLAGADYQAATITAMRPFIASKPDTMGRFLRAWAEGVHAYMQNKSAGMEAIGRFLKLEDQGAIAATYDYFAPEAHELPYPTLKGIQTILDGLLSTQPKAASAKPEDFVDARFVKELEESGLVKNLR